jgi:chloramphenicol O-acetyltransferase type A
MKYIDIEKWPRKAHFEFFHQMDCPQTNVCLNIDATHFLEFVRQNHISFYYAMIFAANQVINEMADFRCRIRKDGIVLHDKVHPSFTDLTKGSDLFKYVTVDMKDDMISFIEYAKEKSESQKELFSNEEEENRDDLVYFTCLPWISFTSLSHTVSLDRDDSIPRISWGKYFSQDDKVLLPFSIQVNHALLDGMQIGKYTQKLQSYIDQL